MPDQYKAMVLSGAFAGLRSGEAAGHNSVAFTLTRYGGLFEDGSEAAVDRLDTLQGGGSKDSHNVLQMDTRNCEVSPERVPEPILTARPDRHKHSEEAFRLVRGILRGCA